jgi:hypothetical protein
LCPPHNGRPLTDNRQREAPRLPDGRETQEHDGVAGGPLLLDDEENSRLEQFLGRPLLDPARRKQCRRIQALSLPFRGRV